MVIGLEASSGLNQMYQLEILLYLYQVFFYFSQWRPKIYCCQLVNSLTDLVGLFFWWLSLKSTNACWLLKQQLLLFSCNQSIIDDCKWHLISCNWLCWEFQQMQPSSAVSLLAITIIWAPTLAIVYQFAQCEACCTCDVIVRARSKSKLYGNSWAKLKFGCRYPFKIHATKRIIYNVYMYCHCAIIIYTELYILGS